jgi:uncharacterized protein
MIARNIATQSWAHQVLALALSFLCCFVLGIALAMAIIPLISDMSPTAFLSFTDFSNKGYLQDLIVVQTIYTLATFAAPTFLYAYLANKNIISQLGFKPAFNNWQYLWAVLAMLCGLGFVGLIAEWNLKIPMPTSSVAAEKKAEELTKAFLDIRTVPQLLLTLFYIALLPAIAEELFFRACLQPILINAFGKHRIAIAIVLTAVLFGLLHGQMLSILPRIFLGIVLGYIYVYTGSIYPCIVGHFFNNGLQVFLTYLHKIGKLSIDVNETPNVALWQGALSLVTCIAALWLVRKFYKPTAVKV